MEEILQLLFKTYGLLGLLLMAPFIAVHFLWKDNKSLRKELSELNKQRIDDAHQVSTSLIKTVTEQSVLNKETNLILERMGETLDRLERT